MRVIAGSARGVRLQSLSGRDVRPTTDRIKESLFNVIGPFLMVARYWIYLQGLEP